MGVTKMPSPQEVVPEMNAPLSPLTMTMTQP
jgi:hypothetical protein